MELVKLWLDKFIQHDVKLGDYFSFKYRGYNIHISGMLKERGIKLKKGAKDIKCFVIDMSNERDTACHIYKIAKNTRELDEIINKEV